MKIVIFLIYIGIIFLGSSFAMLNADLMILDLYWKKIELPVSLITSIFFISGFIIGSLFMFTKQIKLKIELKKIKNQLKLSEQEVNNLRVLPIKNEH